MPIYALGDATPSIDPSAFVHPDAVVIGDVRIGPEASIWPTAVLRGDYGHIVIGARTSIQDGSVLHTTADWPTVVGSGCVVGHNAHLEGCTVGDGCLIGSGSIVLNRASVASGAFVAAGALLAEDASVPAGHLAVGVPARLRRAPAHLPAWISDAVDLYCANAKRYQTELRRLD